MVEIVTQIEIDASPMGVWRVLADFGGYPAWNPFITAIDGRLAAGERLNARIEPPGLGRMTFKPVVLAAEPGRELRWRGVLGAPFLFAGEHRFALDALPSGRARLQQSERFTGLLARPLMSGARLEATRTGFIAMNDALKRRAEAEWASETPSQQ